MKRFILTIFLIASSLSLSAQTDSSTIKSLSTFWVLNGSTQDTSCFRLDTLTFTRQLTPKRMTNSQLEFQSDSNQCDFYQMKENGEDLEVWMNGIWTLKDDNLKIQFNKRKTWVKTKQGLTEKENEINFTYNYHLKILEPNKLTLIKRTLPNNR